MQHCLWSPFDFTVLSAGYWFELDFGDQTCSLFINESTIFSDFPVMKLNHKRSISRSISSLIQLTNCQFLWFFQHQMNMLFPLVSICFHSTVYYYKHCIGSIISKKNIWNLKSNIYRISIQTTPWCYVNTWFKSKLVQTQMWRWYTFSALR